MSTFCRNGFMICRRTSYLTGLADQFVEDLEECAEAGHLARTMVVRIGDTVEIGLGNPIVHANITISARRALRAPTKARCMQRALETRTTGRIAYGEREIVLTRLNFTCASISLVSKRPCKLRPFALAPTHFRMELPTRGVTTQAGVKI